MYHSLFKDRREEGEEEGNREQGTGNRFVVRISP
jgi:hypothetical protein